MFEGAKTAPAITGRMACNLGAKGPLVWLAGVGILGALLGFSLPYLGENSLEPHAIALCAVVFVGIFAMPRTRAYDDGVCWRLFLAMLTLFAIYPSYISLRVSGLPWISPLRLAMALLLFVWLQALRTSPEMQNRIVFFIRENRTFFIFLAVFIGSQILSIPTSRNPSLALQKFVLFQFYWTFPFFAVLTLVNTKGRLALIPALFITFAAIQCFIGFLEARQERLLWLDYLPPGFGADSEVLTRIVQGTFRAEGYRVQGSFTVSLLYAEFLVLMLPFALFAFVDGRTTAMRATGLITAVIILPAQYLSGSRLGVVGSITVFLLLICLYVVRVWRTDRRSMVGPFLLLLLPFAMTLFAIMFVASPRLKALTIGGGVHQASTDSRLEMWVTGIPRILERPLFGHGSGMGAETLGFTNLAGILTIDSYWLSSTLEFGLIGTIALIAMIAWAVRFGFASYVSSRGRNGVIGAAIAVSMVGFVVIKLVLSQTDNHMIIFVMLALLMIIKSDDEKANRAACPTVSPVTGRSPRPLSLRSRKPKTYSAASYSIGKTDLERKRRLNYKLTSSAGGPRSSILMRERRPHGDATITPPYTNDT
jgi:O-antigen ligase